MSNDQDDDEPLTDINVEIDASALAASPTATRENVVTVPAPPLPAELEATTLAPRLVVREPIGPEGQSLPAEYRQVPTVEFAISPSPPLEEDESTALNIESRIRRALSQPESEPPLEETKPRPASSPVLPKSVRHFSMELAPTVPMEFSPPAQVRVDAGPVARRVSTDTVKLVPTPAALPVPPVAVPPAPPVPRSQPQTVLVTHEPRRRRGWTFVLAVLAALVVVGYVKRTAVTAFVVATTTAIFR